MCHSCIGYTKSKALHHLGSPLSHKNFKSRWILMGVPWRSSAQDSGFHCGWPWFDPSSGTIHRPHYGFFFFFFWLHSMACGILVPGPGIEPMPPAIEEQSPNHWAIREVPQSLIWELRSQKPHRWPKFFFPLKSSILLLSLNNNLFLREDSFLILFFSFI